MLTDMKARHSRRTVLTAAAGAAAATVVAAIDRPLAVQGGSDGDVVLGAQNAASATTSIVGSPGITVLEAGGATAPDADGIAIHGSMKFSGADDERLGIAVLGEAEVYSTGVEGRSDTGYGVFGRSELGTGTHGSSHEGTGVDAFSDEGTGVAADSTRGTGVQGSSRDGTALKVYGKAKFQRSGRAWVRAGNRSVTIDLSAKCGLAGTPLCFANLLSYRGGVWVMAVRPNYPSGGKLRIYLNKAVTSRTAVAWLVLDALPGPAPWEL